MDENQIKRLSEEIKLQRFKKNKSQDKCSQVLEMSIPTYRELENHPNKFNLDQIIVLGDYLEINLVEFFLDTILQNAK